MDLDQQEHKKRNWVATVVTVFFLFVIGFFVWRVFYFAGLIRSGDISVDDIQFAGALTSNASLATLPLPVGGIDVETLDDPSLGSVNAPITIVEFADFGCPYSRESSFVLRQLAQANPDKVRFIYRDFPLTEIHPIAQKAAEAGECAQDQGKFWEYHDKLYQNQFDLSHDRLYDFAEELGMNGTQFRSCLDSDRYRDEVIQDYQDGVDAGVRGTPTWFINGNRVSGSVPQELFQELIDSVQPL